MVGDKPVRGKPDCHGFADAKCRSDEGVVADVKMVEGPPQDGEMIASHGGTPLVDRADQEGDQQDGNRRVEKQGVVSPGGALRRTLIPARTTARLFPDRANAAAHLAVAVVSFGGHDA
jgi:hypothetical protein